MNPSGLAVRVWNDTPISRRISDGYVNATAMCQANRKRLNDYTRIERTDAYIAALAAVTGFPATELVASIQGGRPELQGTWIHPRLAVDLARWISPQFAVWMDGWFLESIQQPAPQAERLPHFSFLAVLEAVDVCNEMGAACPIATVQDMLASVTARSGVAALKCYGLLRQHKGNLFLTDKGVSLIERLSGACNVDASTGAAGLPQVCR
jgi:hypothetical protein